MVFGHRRTVTHMTYFKMTHLTKSHTCTICPPSFQVPKSAALDVDVDDEFDCSENYYVIPLPKGLPFGCSLFIFVKFF